jgi:hypothetical protein
MAREKREKVVVVRLSEKEHADLLALSELTGRTGSDAIRRAIRNELIRERIAGSQLTTAIAGWMSNG